MADNESTCVNVVCCCRQPEKQEDLYNMEQYKEQFIEFMIDCNVLKFGEFTSVSYTHLTLPTILLV